jgi:hypothetical protein
MTRRELVGLLGASPAVGNSLLNLQAVGLKRPNVLLREVSASLHDPADT